MTATVDRASTGIGLAIFVKTPGHSALKTRLAAGIGEDRATDFHRLSAEAVSAVAVAAQGRCAGLVPYWAVAEPDALDAPIWSALPRMPQGEGDLGARMERVTATLLAAHGGAMLLGADAPQLCVDDLVAATCALENRTHVIGPSHDGGFWLFATRSAPPAAAWSRTPWSRHDTADRFIAALTPAPTARLRALGDVDTAEDLEPLLVALVALPAALPAQERLAEWLRALVAR